LYPSIQAKVGDSNQFLEEYIAQWKKFSIFTFSMKKLFDYLDRYYLKNGSERCQNLVETALNQFRENVFNHRLNDLRRAILEEIKKDRENEITDKDLIKEGVNQFIYMGYEKKTILKKLEGSGALVWVGEKNLLKYDNEFEAHLKSNTTEYFRKKSELWQQSLSCYEYILKVTEHLKKEESNADYFLQPETKERIVNIVLQEVVENQAE
jgi:hypothetical protein